MESETIAFSSVVPNHGCMLESPGEINKSKAKILTDLFRAKSGWIWALTFGCFVPLLSLRCSCVEIPGLSVAQE